MQRGANAPFCNTHSEQTVLTSIEFDRLVERHPAARKRDGIVRVSSNSEKARRILNVAVALLGIVISLPVMLLVALAVKLTSKGPVFFTQTRVGLDRRSLATPAGNCRRQTNNGGKPFKIYKFRTMMKDAESVGPKVTAGADPRITRSGTFLRKYKLDELPQLINVLKGEMCRCG